MDAQNQGFEGDFEAIEEAVRSALRGVDELVADVAAKVEGNPRVRTTEDSISVVELSGTKDRPRVNLVWTRFPVEPTRSYEAMIEMMVKKDVDNALVTHQGRDLDLYFDPARYSSRVSRPGGS